MDVPEQHKNLGLQSKLHQQQSPRLGARRGLLKVALEAYPLQQAQIPPCNVRSIAIVNREKEEQEDRLFLYLGTDSGHLLLFTWFRSSTPAPPPSKPGGVNEYSSSALFLTANVSLSNGKSPIECLCPLPRSGSIASVLEKQVLLLDLHSLNTLAVVSLGRGVATLSRAFGCTDSLQAVKGRGSSLTGGEAVRAGETIQSPTGLSRRSSGQGQLGRLFGSGKLPGKRGGGWNMLSGESGSMPSPYGGEQASGSPTTSNAGTGPSSPGLSNMKHTGMDRFAVALKQKLLLYEVRIENRGKKGNDSKGEVNAVVMAIKLKEIAGPEEVVTMAWIGNAIITGNFQEYMMYSVIDGSSSLLFTLPKDLVSPPLLKPFPKDVEALLLMDAVGVVVNASGQPTSSSLVFPDIPDAIGQSLTYVIMVKRGLVELYHRKTGAKVQSVMLSDNAIGPHLVTDDDDGKFIAVSSSIKVYCLERVPVDEQLKELLRQRQFDEAVALAEECATEMEAENAKEKLAILHAQAGFLLFFDLQFKDAVDHFLDSSVMHPAEIFPFFPNMTERWRSMVPRNRYWGLHPPPQALQNVIEIKLQAIQRGLVLQAVSDMTELQNGPSLVATPTRSKSAIVEEYTLQATEQVIRYLKIVRSKSIAASLKEGVDTLLMKLFIKVGAIGDMESFAASENSCLVEEVEILLQDLKKLRTLAFLYETKGMQALALQVWQTLAQGNKNQTMVVDMGARRGFYETTASGQDSSQVDAAMEASRLLESCSNGDLVLTHLKWILKISQQLALKILSSPKRSVPISPDAVLLGLGSSETYVQQRYLQWLVQEQQVEDPHYHTQLALSLAQSAMQWQGIKVEENIEEKLPKSSPMKIVEPKSGSRVQEAKNGVQNGYLLHDVSQSKDLENATNKHPLNNSYTSTIPNDVRHKLQEFLDYSDKYDPGMVLAVIKESELWREQAILYRKLGDELAVFQILALKLGDTEAAERYCMELDRPGAYMRLLDMYLKPGEGREPMYSAAVHLLQIHGTSLDPLQVLEALSPDMPLQLAYETIARMFRTRVHLHHEGQIVKHLSRAENFEARLSRLAERARHARINDQTSCGSCFARFGTKLFARYPNDSAVCYKCFRNSGSSIDPVSGHDFKKDPLSSSQSLEKDSR